MKSFRSKSENQFLEERLEEMRKRLLDTSLRNSLLNFKHSENSQKHIRLIDELPDIVYEKLLNGKSLQFKPLPFKQWEPEDEKTEEFQARFKSLSETDEDYLKAIEEASEKDQPYEFVGIAERKLKDKIRKELKWNILIEPKIKNIAEQARLHDLNPSYEMPQASSNVASKHLDGYLQTLLYPDQLIRKLRGLKRYINSDLSETGVNTHYIVFGFLEWQDSESSSKNNYAPILLMQLEPLIEKKSISGDLTYKIESSGEGLQYNLTLKEKMKQFDIVMPEIEEEDSPENYFLKMKNAVKNYPKWKIRRFVTIGRLQFSKLVLYEDLKNENWNINKRLLDSEVIRLLFQGDSSTDHSAMYSSEIYDIDKDTDDLKFAPLLIRDADSSQHSAIIDVMKGKNLVIQGPPGTGKSQTITNLIANAIYSGKRVLFMAEKMAALNVVFSRLKASGLGPFCLELHSNKSKLKDIRLALSERLALNVSRLNPKDFSGKRIELRTHIEELRDYSDIISEPYGNTGESLQNIMWKYTRLSESLPKLDGRFKKISVPYISKYSKDDIVRFLKELSEYLELYNKTVSNDPLSFPWLGVSCQALTILEMRDIKDQISDWKSKIIGFERLIKNSRIISFDRSESIGSVQHQLSRIMKIFQEREFFNRKDTHSIIENPDLGIQFSEIVNDIAYLSSFLEEKSDLLKGKNISLSDLSGLNSIWNEASVDKLTKLSLTDLNKRLSEIDGKRNELEYDLSIIKQCHDKIFLNSIFSERMSVPIAKLIYILSKTNNQVLEIRNRDLFKKSDIENFLKFYEKAELLEKEKIASERILSLRKTDSQEIAELITILMKKNIFSFLSSDFRHARKKFEYITGRQLDNNLIAISQLYVVDSYFRLKREIAETISFRDFNNQGLTDNVNLLRIYKECFHFHAEVSKLFDHRNSDEVEILRIIDLSNDNYLLELKDLISNQGLNFKPDISEFTKAHVVRFKSLPQKIISLNSEYHICKKLLEHLDSILQSKDLSFESLIPISDQSFERISMSAVNIMQFTSAQKDLFDSADIRQILGTCQLLYDGFIFFQNTSKESNFWNSFFQISGEENFSKESSRATQIYNMFGELFKSVSTVFEKLKIDTNIYFQEKITLTKVQLGKFLARILRSYEGVEYLEDYVKLINFLNDHPGRPYEEYFRIIDKDKENINNLVNIFEFILIKNLYEEIKLKNPNIEKFIRKNHSNIVEKFRKADLEFLSINQSEISNQLLKRQPPEGINFGRVSEYTELGLIKHQTRGNPKGIPIRSLIRKAGRAMQELMPCFLMSPLSVAQFLEPGGIEFDILIVDESSQLRPEDALGAIGRCKQIVIVGDSKQLPPTSFFQSNSTLNDEDFDEDSIGTESILDLANGKLTESRSLLWHYRSKDPSLIAFSNNEFYKNLIIHPSPKRPFEYAGLKSIFNTEAKYQDGTNISEVDLIFKEAKKFMRKYPEYSLGIVAMNKKQEILIYNKFEDLFLKESYAESYKLKWQNTLESFFVKNLESVQGDERDVIFISTVYGRGPETGGKVPAQRFGPINNKSGDRRLNVLFTRAKFGVRLFTSLKANDILVNEQSSNGVKVLRNYLEYADNGLLLNSSAYSSNDVESDFELYVKQFLESKGYSVTPQFGVAGYRIDLALKHPSFQDGYLLAIECDGATFHSSKSARDRDRLRQEILESLGWKVYRIWSTDWFSNPDKEKTKLVKYIESLITH